MAVLTHYPLNKRANLMQFAAENPPSDLLGSPIMRQTFDEGKVHGPLRDWLMLRGSVQSRTQDIRGRPNPALCDAPA